MENNASPIFFLVFTSKAVFPRLSLCPPVGKNLCSRFAGYCPVTATEGQILVLQLQHICNMQGLVFDQLQHLDLEFWLSNECSIKWEIQKSKTTKPNTTCGCSHLGMDTDLYCYWYTSKRSRSGPQNRVLEIKRRTRESWIQTSFSLRGPDSSLSIQVHSYSLGFPKMSQKEEAFHSHLRRAKTQNLSHSNSWLHRILTVMLAKFSEKCHCLKQQLSKWSRLQWQQGWRWARLWHITCPRAHSAADWGTRASSQTLEILFWLWVGFQGCRLDT